MHSLIWAVLAALFVVGLVGLVRHTQQRTWQKRWERCLKEAAQIVAGVKAQYPGCEDARCAITTEPNIRSNRTRSSEITEEQWVEGLDLIDPGDTPMMTLMKNEVQLGAKEWKKNVDGFPIPKGATSRADAETAPTSASSFSEDVTSGVRAMGNIAQGFSRTFRSGWVASRLPQIVGMKDIEAEAKRRYFKAMKLDQECAICSFDQVAVLDAGAGLGPVGAGYYNEVISANAYATVSAFTMGKAPSPYMAPASAVITGAMSAGHSRAMWFTFALALRQAAQRNVNWTVLVGHGLNGAISDLTNPVAVTTAASAGAIARSSDQVRVFMRSETDNVLGVMIDLIQTPHGKFMIVPSDWLSLTTYTATGAQAISAWQNTSAGRVASIVSALPNAGLVLQRDNIFKMWGITPFAEQLGKDGGGDAFDIKSSLAWGVRNPVLAGAMYFSS